MKLADQLAPFEREIILKALELHDYNRVKTSEYLGINRTTLFHKMNRYELNPSPKATTCKDKNGYVYLMRDKDYYKIGKSTNVRNRFLSIRSHNPLIELVRFGYSKDYSYLESMLHNTFKHKRVRGEWFDLSRSDLEIIERHLPETNI